MYGYIYLTVCALTKKMYIGARKWDNYSTMYNDTYLGSGRLLNDDIRRYGRRYFSKAILAVAWSLQELNELEKRFISKYNAVDSSQFYNMKAGGGLHPQSLTARYNMKWAHRYKQRGCWKK